MEPGELIDQIGARARAKKAKASVAPEPLAPPQDPEPAAAKGGCLAPDRHPQRDFFVADIFGEAGLKDDMGSMEHPLFALKAGDLRVRRYERNGNSVEVKPGPDGCATIHDKDIWIYCISLLIDALNRGRNDLNRTVRFTAYDFLVTTNRQTSGEGYRLMGEALSRLRATTIETNIETGGQRERRGFGLIDSWHVVEKGPDNRAVAVSVTLPEWLYRSVQARQVLTLSRDYFRIRKPLNRRIYELARKHCGTQPLWRVSVAVLHAKSGSTATLKKFRLNVKALAAGVGGLLDYRLVLDIPTDAVTFYACGPKGTAAQAQAQAAGAGAQTALKSAARRG
jgi:hypothetical protein